MEEQRFIHNDSLTGILFGSEFKKIMYPVICHYYDVQQEAVNI